MTLAYYKLPDGTELEITEAAKTHPYAWEVACLIVSEHIEDGGGAPPALRDFAVKVLKGEWPKPKMKGRPKNEILEYAVIVAISVLAECGARPGRSIASDTTSAIDWVAQQLDKTSEAISSIWKKRRSIKNRNKLLDTRVRAFFDKEID